MAPMFIAYTLWGCGYFSTEKILSRNTVNNWLVKYLQGAGIK